MRERYAQQGNLQNVDNKNVDNKNVPTTRMSTTRLSTTRMSTTSAEVRREHFATRVPPREKLRLAAAAAPAGRAAGHVKEGRIVVLPQGICFCGLWPSFRAFVAQFVDMWGSKSQVLSTSFWRGLHFLRWQGPTPGIGRVWCGSWRAQRAIFQGF